MDYDKKLYDFIRGQIEHLKYAYNRDCDAQVFKTMAEEHYGFDRKILLQEWELAFEWAIADVFGGGCEVETV